MKNRALNVSAAPTNSPRTEGEGGGSEQDKDKDNETPEESAADGTTDGEKECQHCGTPNDKDAKFCDMCGERMDSEEQPPEDTETDETDDDEEKDPDPAAEPPADPNREAQRASAIAPLLGLAADASVPAIKSRMSAFVTLGKAVMKATSTDDPDTALGALQSIVDDAAKSNHYRTENRALAKREQYRERMALLHTLNVHKIYPRGDLFVDREVTRADGKKEIVTVPAKQYAEMKLATLRGLVDSKTKGKSARAVVENPFEPSRELAEGNQLGAHAKELEGSNLVQEFASRSTATPAQLASSLAALQAIGAIEGNSIQ